MLVFEKDTVVGLAKLAVHMNDKPWFTDLSERLKEMEVTAYEQG